MTTQVCEIPKLQDMCFKTFYQKILCKSTPTTVDFVQNCIHQQLMGTMRKTVREKCVKKLNKKYFVADSEISGSQQGVIFVRDICTILDSILDENFSELGVNIPYSTIKLFPLIMLIIGRRCPSLEKLEVDFCTITPTPTTTEMEVQTAVTSSQSPSDSFLHCLSTFNIYYSELTWNVSGETLYCSPRVPLHPEDEPRQSILGVVAKLCPALATLDVCGFHVQKRDFFALLFGERNDTLFPTDNDQWSDDRVLKGLRVPSEFLTPLSFTLKELLFRVDSDGGNAAITPFDSIYAFVLRHLPKLEVLQGSFLSAQVVKVLYKTEMIESKQAEFEERCRDVADRFGRKRKLIGPFNFVRDGPLSLIYLDKAAIDDADTLRAIESLCPHLQKVAFISSPVSKYSTVSPDEIENILKKWPKVVDVKITDVSPAYIKPILSALGSHLNSLEFCNCTQLDLQPFVYCTALEKLTFYDGCSFKLQDGDVTLSAGFLPALKKLFSDSCLGSCSGFFETKSTLTSLILNCSHIGTEAGLPRLEWERMPIIWHRLVFLSLRQSTGLTTSILSNMLPKFRQLQGVVLPRSIEQRERVLFHQMVQEFSGKYAIKLDFFPPAFKFCSYQQQHI